MLAVVADMHMVVFVHISIRYTVTQSWDVTSPTDLVALPPSIM